MAKIKTLQLYIEIKINMYFWRIKMISKKFHSDKVDKIVGTTTKVNPTKSNHYTSFCTCCYQVCI